MLTLKAPGKINLTLEVLSLREDGYHDVASIMQTIDLCDTLSLEPDDNVTLKIDMQRDGPKLEPSSNLALKAATALRELTGCEKGVRLTLEKRIPVAAGLGGGSSDAAAALKGLNQMWGLGLSVEQLSDVAAGLGSDVPFFLHGGTAMVSGRGERVRPLPPTDLKWLVVLTPPIDVTEKTATLYRALGESAYTKGALTRKLEARIRGGGDAPPQFFFNAFDAVAYDAFSGLDEYWSTFSSLGAREIHLAGSGPSMFAPVSRREVGTALQLLLSHSYGWEAHLVSTRVPSTGAAT